MGHGGTRDEQTRSWVNASDRFRVVGAQQSEWGGLRLDLAGGYALVVPAGHKGEAWRFFAPGSDADRLVFPDPAHNEVPL